MGTRGFALMAFGLGLMVGALLMYLNLTSPTVVERNARDLGMVMPHETGTIMEQEGLK